MKRIFDVVVSASALLLAAPFLLAIGACIRGEDGGPALFRQQRIGRNGRTFRILKFRTMRVGAGGPAITAAGDSRVTRVGARLRRWKLDELPQLWNVLRGDMSLVGPRPEVPEYVALYPEDARALLTVRPGITGPAQLLGLDEEEELSGVSDPERFYREVVLPRKLEIDLRYARDASLTADLRVLLQTLRQVVFRPEGASDAR